MNITQLLVAMEAPKTVVVTAGYLHCLECDEWCTDPYPTLDEVDAFTTDHSYCAADCIERYDSDE